MVKTSRTSLFHDDDSSYVLKGLLSGSILEPPVPTRLNGKSAGAFQALEMFERNGSGPSYPQTVADLISNTYFRLSYLQPSGCSGTFGSSVVGSVSFRPRGSQLFFIPTVERADVVTRDRAGPEVALIGRYGEIAEVRSVRAYNIRSELGLTTMSCHVTVCALQEIQLDPACLGNDAFRLLTLSSMYARPDRYDGNLLRWGHGTGVAELDLRAAPSELNGYLLKHPQAARELSVLKQRGSTAPRLSPGAVDSPSISAKVVGSSMRDSELGAQAFVSRSHDVNQDSLTAWIEWTKVPPIIPKGTEHSWTFEISASPPI
ncbi:MAG: hypothetical protein U0136_21700 [Bdellovibrionota bacterium]